MAAIEKKMVFEPLNSFFDKIYVLTLPHMHKRQENVREQLAGLNWTFFYGVDKKDLTSDYIASENLYDSATHLNTKRTSRDMTLGEIACALSHRNIMQDAVDNGYKRILVFEDDVKADVAVLSNFENYMDELPQDWDVILLGYYNAKRPSITTRLQNAWYFLCHLLHIANWQKFHISLFRYLTPRSYSKNFYSYHRCVGTHAYALNLETAKKYIDYQTPVILQSDRVFMYYNLVEELKVYMPKVPFFKLDELAKDSYIQ